MARFLIRAESLFVQREFFHFFTTRGAIESSFSFWRRGEPRFFIFVDSEGKNTCESEGAKELKNSQRERETGGKEIRDPIETNSNSRSLLLIAKQHTKHLPGKFFGKKIYTEQKILKIFNERIFENATSS